MAYTVLVQSQVAAMNIDALNIDCIDLVNDNPNGAVLAKGTLSNVAGYGEVFNVAAPTAIGLGLWMAYSPEVVEYTINGKSFRGLSVDPRDFINSKGKVFNAFKPRISDIILVTLDAFTGGVLGASNTFANAIVGASTLTGGTTATANGMSFKVINANATITIANGGVMSQKVPAVMLECVAN